MIFKSRKQIDITDSNELERIIIKNNPNMIINCAAFTNVDLSEKKRISMKINSTAIKDIILICKKFNIFSFILVQTTYLIQINLKSLKKKIIPIL